MEVTYMLNLDRFLERLSKGVGLRRGFGHMDWTDAGDNPCSRRKSCLF